MSASKSRRPLAECWCCGRSGIHAGRGLCGRCYQRWHSRNFAGAGPGPEFASQAAKAAEYSHVITVLSLRRTVQRWRKALREAA